MGRILFLTIFLLIPAVRTGRQFLRNTMCPVSRVIYIITLKYFIIDTQHHYDWTAYTR
jgi:hypothetical protein